MSDTPHDMSVVAIDQNRNQIFGCDACGRSVSINWTTGKTSVLALGEATAVHTGARPAEPTDDDLAWLDDIGAFWGSCR